jgi:hypothetical protein
VLMLLLLCMLKHTTAEHSTAEVCVDHARCGVPRTSGSLAVCSSAAQAAWLMLVC